MCVGANRYYMYAIYLFIIFSFFFRCIFIIHAQRYHSVEAHSLSGDVRFDDSFLPCRLIRVLISFFQTRCSSAVTPLCVCVWRGISTSAKGIAPQSRRATCLRSSSEWLGENKRHVYECLKKCMSCLRRSKFKTNIDVHKCKQWESK